MPLFEKQGRGLSLTEQTNFAYEKDLQALIEENLETVFSCQFVATEFSTGVKHSGRIDTLALSEDGNPVIIEYKKVESSDLINQSLYYLNWIADHRGDFELAARSALGNDVQVDWSDIRVICLAPNYKKYDLHAVEVMQANIELWRYRLFGNGSLFIEEVFTASREASSVKSPASLAAKKAAQVRKTAVYTLDSHLKGKSKDIQSYFLAVQEFILGLDEKIDEVPKKFYAAYKSAKNFACVEVMTRKVVIYLKLTPSDFETATGVKYRDVTNIGHFGTGNAEVTIESQADLDATLPYLELSFQRVGGA